MSYKTGAPPPSEQYHPSMPSAPMDGGPPMYQPPQGAYPPPQSGAYPPPSGCPPGVYPPPQGGAYPQPPPYAQNAAPQRGPYPPYGGRSSPSQYPAYSNSQNTVAPKGGLFADLSRGIGSIARTLDSQAGKLTFGDKIITQLRSRNVVQVYTTTHSALQIVVNQCGQLTVDARGPLSPQAFHAHFTVSKEISSEIVKLYNNNNYLAVIAGNITVAQAPSPQAAGLETRFRARQSDRGITLEPLGMPDFFLHVDKHSVLSLKEGYMSATAFYVQIVHAPK